MARPLPAGMAAIIKAASQQPTYSVLIQDLINRFSVFASSPGNTGRSHAILTSAGSIIRAYVSSAGAVYIQRVTNPSQPAGWATPYTLFSSGASTTAGCCLIQSGGRIRLFVASTTGTINYYDSTNDGQTFGAGGTLPASPMVNGLCYGIAAQSLTSVTVIFASWPNAASALYKSSFTTSWLAWQQISVPNWAGGQLRGISVAGNVFAAGVQLSYPQNGISTATSIGLGTPWTEVQPVHNPALGIAASNPHLSFIAGVYYLTVITTDSGSSSTNPHSRVVVYTSTDGSSWSPWQEAGSSLQSDAHTIISGSNVFILDSQSTLKAPPAGSLSDVSNDVLALSVSESTNSPADLTLVLSNERGQYNNHPSVRADARITVAFGYGSQTVTTHQFILDSFSYQLGPAISELTISARNHLKLLDYPQQRFLVYQAQTISQLVTAVCKAAGIPLAPLPSTAQFSQTVPCFVITPGESWRTALDRLAVIYGFDYFADPTPRIRIQERLSSDSPSWAYATEAFAFAYGQSADQANFIRVVGQSTGTSNVPSVPVFSDILDSQNILTTGRERFRNIVDRQLDTAARCYLRAQLSLREEQMAATHAEISCSINPQHELLDVISLSDPFINLSNQPLRIHSISWLAEPEHGTWEMKLQCSGV